jgi:hypothetical protein
VLMGPYKNCGLFKPHDSKLCKMGGLYTHSQLITLHIQKVSGTQKKHLLFSSFMRRKWKIGNGYEKKGSKSSFWKGCKLNLPLHLSLLLFQKAQRFSKAFMGIHLFFISFHLLYLFLTIFGHGN